MALVINGERIDDAVIDQEFSQIKATIENQPGAGCVCDRDEEFRRSAKRNITGRVVLVQKARETIPEIPEEEVDQRFEQIKAEHGGEGPLLMAVGLTRDQMHLLRQEIETNMRVERLVDQVCGEPSEPDEEELRRFYNDHIHEYMSPERVHAMHILKRVPQVEQREATLDELRRTREQLIEGGDFEATAEEVSDEKERIDLGTFQRGELPDEFEVVAFSLREGEVSPVFTTSFGLHLTKVLERQPATPMPFEEARDDVARRHKEDQREERLQAYVNQLEAEATVEDLGDDVEEDDDEEAEEETAGQEA